MITKAYFSDDRRFRYWLLRTWYDRWPLLAVIGCNPSTADETANDPTIRKVIGFAERMEFGGVLMLNVGAFRATQPRLWNSVIDPFGPENAIADLEGYIAQFKPEKIVAAWGEPCQASPRGRDRASEIARRICPLYCWGKNKSGSPRHPLMIPYSTPLTRFSLGGF